MTLKLQQDQLWQTADAYLRIVRLERLWVSYKNLKILDSSQGTHHKVSKKEFTRMLKFAKLVVPEKGESAVSPSAEVPSATP